jgi:acyl-CoA reductase-like NAD-dependent aldehyde dehydrogenase
MGMLAAQMLAAQSASSKSNGQGAERIKSYAPATGELLGEAPVMGPEEVRAAVARARRGQQAWGALSVAERCRRVLRFRDAIVDRQDELIDLLSRETGKPLIEALMHEVTPSATVATYFAKHGPEILAPREVPLDLLKHRKAVLHYPPRGVVGCITPWNYPFYMPFRDIFLALIAGNAVVLKPSEVTPLIALRAKAIWDESGMPVDLLQVVTGYGATGAALIDAGVDFVIFTGGVSTGRRVAAACGERLIPCVMELGGEGSPHRLPRRGRRARGARRRVRRLHERRAGVHRRRARLRPQGRRREPHPPHDRAHQGPARRRPRKG